ncbi:MAG: hypothetical protein M3421_12710, partial [Bacteroidota bacterium]|nr:hypothetical protein [Bacteroidota bacterium]
DVVALQEILDLNVLQTLANRLDFHAFAAEPDSRGNRVAFLTREMPVQPVQELSVWRLLKLKKYAMAGFNNLVIQNKR